MLLRVTNRNNFIFRDRYDGIDYVFPPNEAVIIEEGAARHFFGYGLIDKVPAMVRQGWVVSSDRVDDGTRKLNNFIFEQGNMTFSEKKDEIVEDEDIESKPVPATKRYNGKNHRQQQAR